MGKLTELKIVIVRCGELVLGRGQAFGVQFLTVMGKRVLNEKKFDQEVILYHLQGIVEECPNTLETAIWLLFACQPHQGLSLDIVINIDEVTSLCK